MWVIENFIIKERLKFVNSFNCLSNDDVRKVIEYGDIMWYVGNLGDKVGINQISLLYWKWYCNNYYQNF